MSELSNPESLTCRTYAGAIDAAVMSIPFNLQAESVGFPMIYDLSAQKIPYLQNGLATSRDFATDS